MPAWLFSILLAAGHLANPGENGIVMVFIDGMVMCFSLWRTGDLWFAIGNHAPWDWGESFLFGTPNSGTHIQHALMNPPFHGPTLLAGGSDGPEGSVLVSLSKAFIVVLVAIFYPTRRFPLITDQEPLEMPDPTRNLMGRTKGQETPLALQFKRHSIARGAAGHSVPQAVPCH